MRLLKRIHINMHYIRANRKDGGRRPVVAVRTSRGVEYGHRALIKGPAQVIYSPDKPLSCGARVWIETRADVEVVDDGGSAKTD